MIIISVASMSNFMSNPIFVISKNSMDYDYSEFRDNRVIFEQNLYSFLLLQSLESI